VVGTWIYKSTKGSVLATILYHWSITAGSVVPVVPGVLAAVVFAVVNMLAAAGAVVASAGSLLGLRSPASGQAILPATVS
jgi:hypothetical protein